MGCSASTAATGSGGGGPASTLAPPAPANGSTSSPANTTERTKRHLLIDKITPNEELGELLKKVPLFAHVLKMDRDLLAGALQERSFAASTEICAEGVAGDKFYIIRSGKAKVCQTLAGQDESVCVNVLAAGDYFGEQSLLTGSARNAAVSAQSDMVVWSLDKDQFVALFQERINVVFAERGRGAVTAGVLEFTDSLARQGTGMAPPRGDVTPECLAILNRAISKCLLFRELDEQEKEEVSKLMYQKKFAKGETIIVEGDLGEHYYVVEDGEIDVYQKDTDERLTHGTGAKWGKMVKPLDHQPPPPSPPSLLSPFAHTPWPI
jgi:CRP-like cAMP-binding protein